MSYVECIIFILDYEEPHPLQPEPPKQDSTVSGYALLPRIEPELKKRCLSLFSPEHVHVIRVGEECPDALTVAVRSDRVSIMNFLLCPSECAVYNDSIPASRKSQFFTVEVSTMKHVFNSEKPMTYENTRTVFKDDGCLLFMFILIQHRADINFVSKAGTTFLHLAIFKRCDLLIRFLLRNGASIGIRTHKDETALHMAIRFRLPDAILKHLIGRATAADINAIMTGVGYSGVTPLQLALQHVISLESIECLLDNGADVNACDKEGCTIIKEAVWMHPEALPYILAQGSLSLSSTGVLRKVLKPRLTITQNNAKDFNKKIKDFNKDKPDISGSIAKLLDHGFDLDPEDAEDVRVLSDAIKVGNIELVLRLLRWGASLTDECNGMTALHTAAAYASPSMIRALLDHGADINIRAHFGERPLTSAARFGNFEAMKCLLKRGAKLENHPSILHDVIFPGTSRSVEIVKFLIDVGVDVNSTHDSHTTPATRAFHYGKKDILEVLIERGGRLHLTAVTAEDPFTLIRKGKLTIDTTIDFLRSGGDAEKDMIDLLFEVFISGKPRVLSLFLMLEYPVAVSIEHAMGDSLRDFPCSTAFLKTTLELEYLSFNRIFPPGNRYFARRDIYVDYDDDFKDIGSNRDDDHDYLIMDHVASLLAADLKINKEMKTDLELKHREEAGDLAEKYAEVSAMKNTYILDTGKSFYNILDATIPQILSFLQNNTLAVFEALTDEESYVQFPSFYGMIRKRSCKAYFRKLLLDQGMEMLDVLMSHNGHPPFPPEISVSIVDFLTNQQLLVFSKTCKLSCDDRFLNDLINLTSFF